MEARSLRYYPSFAAPMGNENGASNLNSLCTHQKPVGSLKMMASQSNLKIGTKRGILADLSNNQLSSNVNKTSKDGRKDGFKAPAHRCINIAKPIATQASKPLYESRPSAATRSLNVAKTVVYQDLEPVQHTEHLVAPEVDSRDILNSEDDTEAVYEDAVEEFLAEATTRLPRNSYTLPDEKANLVPAAAPQSLPLGVEDGEENYSDCYSELDEDSFPPESQDCPSQKVGEYTSYTQTGYIYGPVLAPDVNDFVKKELQIARNFVATSETPEEIEEELGDIGMVREYSDDIFQYMLEVEDELKPDPHYMDRQTELRWSMRSVLIDWVVQVHARFHLYPETLHLSINLIDRFLSEKVISLGKLQLVGATALLIASKYEEVNVPSVREMVYMVDEGYQAEEILKAEKYMSNLLGWKLGYPSPLNFLRRASKADDYDEKIRTVTKYLIEVALMDERFIASGSSLIAAGSHCFARLILCSGSWTPSHVYYSGYTYEQLVVFMINLQSCLAYPQKHHPAVYDKYKDSRFEPAITVAKGLTGFVLPSPSYVV